jgi:predicted amidohydrolase YtcJ
MVKLIAVLSLAVSLLHATDKADLVVRNGAIYTGDPNLGVVNAIAIRGGKVVATGKDAEKIPFTEVIDLQGAFVMPGFNDAHLHLANGGFEKLNVNLIGTTTLAEMQARIAERVKTAKPGEWIIGRGWDHTKWDVKETPTRKDIDQITGDHPAAFTRVDGHIAIVNTAALIAAGVTRDAKDPDGGKIDRDEKGEPTGILRETAMSLVGAHIPPPSREQRRRALELALADAAEWGLTSAQDNSSWEDFLVYEQLQKEGKLTLRISEWLPFDEPIEDLKRMRAHHRAEDPMLHTGMLKGFMDGSLGSRTAALLAPYSDDQKNSGIPRYTQEQLNRMVKQSVDAGFQIGLHAIGDQGAGMALSAFEKTGKRMRHRIEHDQVITPAQFAKYKKLGVIASMQPNHLLTDMNWAESRIGAERAKTSYPWRQFLESGVPLAFGTDYPVEPITPFRGLYAAVTRMNEAGTKTYPGAQALTIDQAIAAYTTGSAYAEFAEKTKGTLAPGMWADFVVLDRDVTKIKPGEILKTKVLRTVVGGKTVYER